MVKQWLKNGSQIFLDQQKSILSGASVIAFMSLLAALLGLIKQRLYAGVLGVGVPYDTFVAAFKIPDVIFQLIIVGSLNAAFIPLFSQYISNEESKKAWGFASSMINFALIFFLVIGIVIFFLARPIGQLLVPGFSGPQLDELINLMRIMLLSPILLSVSTFISGTLQSFRRFLVPFLSPLAYNLGAIFGILFLYQPLGLTGLAWGVVLGAFLHLIIQVPLLAYLGYRHQFVLNLRDKIFKQVVHLTAPRALGLGAEQIKQVVLLNLLSLLPAGSISALRFADSIQTVPIVMFGVSLAQASLPVLVETATKRDWDVYKKTLVASLNQILYFTIPISVALIALKIPITRLVLGIGRFDWPATILTSWILAILAVSLFAQSINHLLIRAFYAMQDTKTPVAISTLSVIFSLVLAFILGRSFEVQGVAAAVSLGALLELALLFFALGYRIKLNWVEVLAPAAKILFAGAVMFICIYVPVHYLDEVFIDTRRVVNLVILVWLVLSFAGTVYLVLSWILGIQEIRLLLNILWRIKSWREAVISAQDITSFSSSQTTKTSD